MDCWGVGLTLSSTHFWEEMNWVVIGGSIVGGEMGIELRSVLTCPHCGFQKVEAMPTDSCQFFYECTNCKEVLRPKPGDCCVFWSYGTVRCPSKQAEDEGRR